MISKIRKVIDPINYIGRYNDGHRDLVKGLQNGLQITKEQKKEILAYWKTYRNSFIAKTSFDIKWYNIYNKTNVFGFDLKKYIPDSFYYCVVDSFFNDSQAALALDDKNLYDFLFHDVNQPKTICRKQDGVYLDANYNVVTENDALNLCKDNGCVIIKPAVDACAGAGIVKWVDDNSNDDKLKEAFKKTRTFVGQDILKQSLTLAKFNESSVNTMRIVTLMLGGEVHVVTAVVIIGGRGATTNHLHGGGMCCGILPDGQLMKYAFDGKLNQYEQHPCGAVFSKFKIPNYDKCISLVKELAPRLCRVSKLVAWDISLNQSDEPVLIETNLRWGGSVQIAAGPVFGDMTEDVLNWISKK